MKNKIKIITFPNLFSHLKKRTHGLLQKKKQQVSSLMKVTTSTNAVPDPKMIKTNIQKIKCFDTYTEGRRKQFEVLFDDT